MPRNALDAMPPRPPECRPPAEDMWAFGSSHMVPRDQEGDPCGSGPMAVISSDEDGETA
jgi:hypothetical protein